MLEHTNNDSTDHDDDVEDDHMDTDKIFVIILYLIYNICIYI